MAMWNFDNGTSKTQLQACYLNQASRVAPGGQPRVSVTQRQVEVALGARPAKYCARRQERDLASSTQSLLVFPILQGNQTQNGELVN
ncbi:hypothetical protein PCANC_02285 [Puccinia coronata f. sp. avenae]|uniref:Uncharacterized protein n=1 Tax=Puccinia coronata f. sp. avenae TaxID=200324 RepID=A0A2N5VZE9_9BASI|nr:hypothetical protein PCANC_02285 [Puccinia coronata f. sp. avenae]